MSSTRPITSADAAFAEVLRSALGLGLCAVALLAAGMAFLRAGDRLAVLDAAAGIEEAALSGDPAQRERMLTKSAETLVAAVNQRPSDHAAQMALARLRLLQASALDVAQSGPVLADAERAAAAADKHGAPKVETAVLRAEIAFALGGVDSEAAAAFVRESYAARALDAHLGAIRARLGLALWGDLDPATREKVQAEVCLALRTAPSLDASFKEAAVAAHAPLLPTDYATWTADPGCQPTE